MLSTESGSFTLIFNRMYIYIYINGTWKYKHQRGSKPRSPTADFKLQITSMGKSVKPQTHKQTFLPKSHYTRTGFDHQGLVQPWALEAKCLPKSKGVFLNSAFFGSQDWREEQQRDVRAFPWPWKQNRNIHRSKEETCLSPFSNARQNRQYTVYELLRSCEIVS